MIELAPDVWMVSGFPPHVLNIYVIGDVLIDSGTRYARRRIMRQLAGHRITAHALTHGHGDHQGSSQAICTELNIPLWCGAGDAHAVEHDTLATIIPRNPVTIMINLILKGPAHPVDRQLKEGDEVAGFTVLETPGHSPGHISFWRERDRVLILGDILFRTLTPRGLGVGEPPRLFTMDPALNRRSTQKFRGLDPAVVCFGHGPPLRDPGLFNATLDRLA